MTKLASLLLCLAFLGSPLAAQRRTVRAVGQAILAVKPDQVRIDVGVSTTGASAQEASTQNASQMTAVLNQLRKVLGPTGDIATVGYSITPNYRYTQGAPPVLLNYTATNTVEITSSDLSVIVSVIDTASQAGATSVQGLRFTLKDDEPVRRQVLGMAAKQARAHAEAIAAGLGAQVGGVIAAQEGVSVTPLATDRTGTGAVPTPTPIETGMVTVQATVTLDAEIIQ